MESGRRAAGYVIATTRARDRDPDDPGKFIPIDLVNQIRPRVNQWREDGYPGATNVTRRLLEHWHTPIEGTRQFFFCQLEAIETLIWLTEAPDAYRQGINVPFDGGPFRRYCSKMATGSGKTIVMGMLIAWQIINKATYPQDSRFVKNVLVIAPGLTVKSRLAVLQPDAEKNYYTEFDIIPPGMHEKMRMGKVMICNWHKLNWEDEEQIEKKRSVDKRGVKSDEAYAREVLEDMANARNILVINDEAHHAWRVPAEIKKKQSKEEKKSAAEATIWVGGLDRIHAARGIHCCYDFSATPFAPSGKQSYEEALFTWIVSDFSLNDAIESGLVKTPLIVVRDDVPKSKKVLKSKLFHIYEEPEVKDDLNRRAEENEPLPDLLVNAYYLLGTDWLSTYEHWKEHGLSVPPVMITVANRTETAARIAHAFTTGKIKLSELGAEDHVLHIDSKVLAQAEEKEETEDPELELSEKEQLTKKEYAELLRQKVDTVGKKGQPGQYIRNVISVGMLSEGWDAKTVTHIMGLRAFTSQLLCEQVVGRGLRRTSYELENGMFPPEYVNIFGVPFTFLPHESPEEDGPAEPPRTVHEIEPDDSKREYEIEWPNIIRFERVPKPTLEIDWSKVKPLHLDLSNAHTIAELAPTIAGFTDLRLSEDINFLEIADQFRMQTIIFDAASQAYDRYSSSWRGNKALLLAQVVKFTSEYIARDMIQLDPPIYQEDETRRKVAMLFLMSRVVGAICENLEFNMVERNEPVLDPERSTGSTGFMNKWHTTRPCEHVRKSHINMSVFDGSWEDSHAFALDRNKHVEAWAKNDHLNFVIYYIYQGSVRRYLPDFIVRLTNGEHLILETKGIVDDQAITKARYAEQWIDSVNEDGRWGTWHYRMSTHPSEVDAVIAEVAK